MNCDRAKSLLSAHLDGELDAVNDRDLQEHLRACTACQREEDQLRVLQRMIRSDAPRHRAAEGLTARVRTSLRNAAANAEAPEKPLPQHAPERRRWLWQWGFSAAAIAAAVVAAWIGSTVTARRAAADYETEELISAHVRSLLADHLTDVPSSDQHTVKPWFAGKVDFAPPVRDLSAQGFPLIGGRLDYVWGQAVAALVFQRNKHVINVFVWPPPAGTAAPEPTLTRRGYNMVAWKQGELTLCAVSDLNLTELQQFAGEYRGQ